VKQSGTTALEARKILPFCLDSKQLIDEQQTKDVFKAIRVSTIAHKLAIMRELARVLRLYDHEQRAVVTSAQAVSPALQRQIMATISAKHPTIRYAVWEIDPTLVGGITIMAVDSWYDLSLQGRLRQIAEGI
jgi:F0F1-type ATP synthase delta subunit